MYSKTQKDLKAEYIRKLRTERWNRAERRTARSTVVAHVPKHSKEPNSTKRKNKLARVPNAMCRVSLGHGKVQQFSDGKHYYGLRGVLSTGSKPSGALPFVCPASYSTA